MASFAADSDNAYGQTAFAGPAANRLYDPNQVPESKEPAPSFADDPGFFDVQALSTSPLLALFNVGFPGAPVVSVVFKADVDTAYNAAQEWFETIVVRPQSIALGNVLTTIIVAIELFNADRYESHELQNFTNNAGDGISLTDLPPLVYSIPLLHGLTVHLEVTPDGPATIDGTLDFDFDLYVVSIPITGQRLVVFGFRPEVPMQETLRFLTEVIDTIDGGEQRIALRKRPRQEYDCTFRLEGPDRQALENLLFEWQGRAVGFPVWTDSALLTAAVSIGATTLNVDTTEYSDFRVGSLLIVFKDRVIYDASRVTAINKKSLVIETPLENAYLAGTEVMPVRTAFASRLARGSRQPVAMQDLSINFRVVDNDVDLASAAAFSSLLGKVLFDSGNIISSDLEQLHDRRLYIQDGETGVFDQDSLWDRTKVASAKGFTCHNRQQLWQMRQVLHYLRGRLKSFYLPTFYDELTPTANLTSGSSSLTITNVGYTNFVQNRRGKLRVVKTDGTVILRNVTSSAVVDDFTEQITVDAPWPSTITVAQVKRIEYIQLVRSSADGIQIRHRTGTGFAAVRFPVIEVLA